MKHDTMKEVKREIRKEIKVDRDYSFDNAYNRGYLDALKKCYEIIRTHEKAKRK